MSRKRATPQIPEEVVEDLVSQPEAVEPEIDPIARVKTIATADQNESVTDEQAAGISRVPKTNGPLVGEMGEYRSAQYPVRGGKITRIDS